jgi:hypothetical protein
LTVTLPLPFRRSRTLERGNALLDDEAVALDVVGLDLHVDIFEAWRARVAQVGRALDWAGLRTTGWPCDATQTLAFTAPANQLCTAREANEWALCAAVLERDPCHWSALRDVVRAYAGDPSIGAVLVTGAPAQSDAAALARLAQLGLDESRVTRPV